MRIPPNLMIFRKKEFLYQENQGCTYRVYQVTLFSEVMIETLVSSKKRIICSFWIVWRMPVDVMTLLSTFKRVIKIELLR